jgi:predicted PurR-regulated permease PerM
MEHPPVKASLAQISLTLAAVAFLLGAMRVAAPILNPLLFALVLSLIFSPLYSWLGRKLPGWLALVVMLLIIALLFGGLFYIVSISVTSMATRLTDYVTQLDNRVAQIETLLGRFGLSPVHLNAVVNGGSLTGVLKAVLGGVGSLLSNASLILMTTLFFLAEGPYIMARLRQNTAADNRFVVKLNTFGQSVVRQFGLRGIVNAVTGVLVATFLLLLGVDFPLLWGVLTFFLSYIPYIGIVLAAIPAVVLALAEFGLGRSLVVVLGFVAANILAENVLSPALLSRGLSISPTAVFVSFAFWTWLLGGPGAFLAMPLTFFVILILDSFPESRWLTGVLMVKDAPEQPEQGAR